VSDLAYYVQSKVCGIDLKLRTIVMGKEQKSNKEAKKVPALSAKEKKAAKKAKKNERGRLGE